jgi:ribose transport system permease protein
MSENSVAVNNKTNKKKFKLSPPVTALLTALLLFLASGLLPNGYNSVQTAVDQAFNIIRLSSFLAIIAAGQTLVIISGGEGIDLSAGSVVTIAALFTYRFINGDNSMVLPVLLFVLAIGAVVGLVNGLGIAFLRIPPFVMTLGVAGVVQGTLLVVTRGLYDGRVAPIMTKLIARDLVFGIPGMIFLWIIFGIFMTLLLRRTRFGKQLFAIGVNRTTARLSGVRVTGMVIATYVIAGALAAFSGFVLVGWTQNAGLQVGNQYLFPSIAAVAVGGTLLSGGVGTYFGTMAGAVVIQLITSLLTTMGLPEATQQMVYGSVLLILMIIYGREKGLRL